MANTTRKRRGRGEGSIFQRGDGYWVAVLSSGFDGTGKRRRKTVYGKTKKEVQDKLKDEGYSLARGTSLDAGKITLADYLELWLAMKQSRTAPATWARYKSMVKTHITPRLGGVRLDKITAAHAERLYLEMEKDELSGRTRQLAGVTLSGALSHAVATRLIPFNPVRDIKKPRPAPRQMMTWTKEEATAFRKATANDRLHALYTLALATGMRQGELFALQWSDVDFGGSYVVVRRSLEDLGGNLRVKEPKTGKGRRIDLPQFAIDALHDHRKLMVREGNHGGTVFVMPDGNYLRRTTFYRTMFQPAVKAAGVPEIRFHDLRHTHATLLLAAGEHVKVVSERLGHASVQITLNTYAHVLPTMQKNAADKLQKMFA
jgi:integrase